MKYLLDTHTLIWSLEEDKQLSTTAQNIIADDNNQIFASVVNLWEMAIKISIGKLQLQQSLEQVIDKIDEYDISLLPIKPAHVIKVRDLPFEHNDPFDRLLIAQCLQEDMAFISNEALFLRYGVNRIW
jgi:PIN domain nuclease of toxin-antitoxin system